MHFAIEGQLCDIGPGGGVAPYADGGFPTVANFDIYLSYSRIEHGYIYIYVYVFVRLCKSQDRLVYHSHYLQRVLPNPTRRS